MRLLRVDRGSRGFTLIEILVTVTIFAMIFTILMPMLITSLQKAKQKRVVADMRQVGMAWYSWLTDNVSAAAAGSSSGTYDFVGALADPVSAEDLLNTLYVSDEVFYIQTIPERDAWGTPYEYRWSGQKTYSGLIGIRSLGRDQTAGPSANPYTMGPFDSTRFAEDIVWADGFFVRYPAGTLSQ